jgi:hypothetical protein
MSIDDDMYELRMDMPEKGRKRVIYELAKKNSNPLNSLKESITNGMDAIDMAGIDDGKIIVALDPYTRRVIVQDNADGMSQEYMDNLSQNIGNSIKHGKLDSRGEKAVGLLDFGGIGPNLYLLSRERGIVVPYTNYVNWRIMSDKEGEVVRAFGRKRGKNSKGLTKKEMVEDFYGEFQHGTQAVVSMTEDVFKEKLTKDEIISAIRDMYTPLFFSNRIQFAFGEIKKDFRGNSTIEDKLIGAPEIKGDVLLREKIPFITRKTKWDPEEEVNLEVFLTFNTDDEDGRVGVFSKDVKVYDSVTDLEKKFKKDIFWGCPFVRGYINEPSLKLTLGRDGIVKGEIAGTKPYNNFIEVLEKISVAYTPIVEEQMKRIKDRTGNERLEEIIPVLKDIYQYGTPLNIKRRTTIPDPDENDDDNSDDPIIPGEEPPVPLSDDPENPSEDPPIRRRKLGIGVRQQVFPDHQKHLESRVAKDHQGNRYIGLNKGHDSWSEVMGRGSADYQRKHMIDLVIGRLPECEILDAFENGKSYTLHETPTKLADRLEELRTGQREVKVTKKKDTKKSKKK